MSGEWLGKVWGAVCGPTERGVGREREGTGLELVRGPEKCRGKRVWWSEEGSKGPFNWGWISRILGSRSRDWEVEGQRSAHVDRKG